MYIYLYINVTCASIIGYENPNRKDKCCVYTTFYKGLCLSGWLQERDSLVAKKSYWLSMHLMLH